MYVRVGPFTADPTDSHVQGRIAPQTRRQKHLGAGFTGTGNDGAGTPSQISPRTRDAQARNRHSRPHAPAVDDWHGVSHFFTTLTIGGLTGLLAALTVALLGGGYATARRVTVWPGPAEPDPKQKVPSDACTARR